MIIEDYINVIGNKKNKTMKGYKKVLMPNDA